MRWSLGEKARYVGTKKEKHGHVCVIEQQTDGKKQGWINGAATALGAFGRVQSRLEVSHGVRGWGMVVRW